MASSAELQARRGRVSRVRRRVIAGASLLFAVLSAAIAVQLTTGHDPALASAAKAQPDAATKPDTSSSATGTDPPDGAGEPPWMGGGGPYPGDESAGDPGSDNSAGPSSGQVAPLTTRQS
jgi:hypothetical protein